jgi:hypothetical protein
MMDSISNDQHSMDCMNRLPINHQNRRRYLVAGWQYLAFITLFTLAARPILSAHGQSPEYADDETRRIVLKMVDAHGGYDIWANAPSISFDNTFYNPFAEEDENPWWFARESIDQKTRRVFQDWEVDKAVLVFDGKETWTTNWRGGNPPRFMVHFFYYFVNLPWLSQDDNVRLSALGRASLPGYSESFYTVKMSFTDDPAEGKVKADTYKLFINPDTFLLQGYEYSIGYGAMLDLFGLPAGELFGPMLRVHDTFTERDGLVFPSRMHTMAPDGSQTWGHHIITQVDIKSDFDELWMVKPQGAVVDQSSSVRK